MKEKVFLIFNTAQIGDILIDNVLVQNIKLAYPDSKVVFVVKPSMVEVAKYQLGVDEVVELDKKKIKNPLNFIKYLIKFPYKRPFASFVMYANERNLLISKLLGARHINSTATNVFRFLHTREKFKMRKHVHSKDEAAGLLEPLVGEVELRLPIRYVVPEFETDVVKMIEAEAQKQDLIAISTASNFYKKDMPIESAVKIIEELSKLGKEVVFTGAGEVARRHLAEVKEKCSAEFIDLVDKTSFPELARILEISKGLISVDTGTMHFGNAVNCPTVAVFYTANAENWAPDERLYPAKLVDKDYSVENIIRNLMEIIR